MNLGFVELQGKMDIDKAVAWQKLLDTNPNYEGNDKDKVEELIAQAQNMRV